MEYYYGVSADLLILHQNITVGHIKKNIKTWFILKNTCFSDEILFDT